MKRVFAFVILLTCILHSVSYAENKPTQDSFLGEWSWVLCSESRFSVGVKRDNYFYACGKRYYFKDDNSISCLDDKTGENVDCDYLYLGGNAYLIFIESSPRERYFVDLNVIENESIRKRNSMCEGDIPFYQLLDSPTIDVLKNGCILFFNDGILIEKNTGLDGKEEHIKMSFMYNDDNIYVVEGDSYNAFHVHWYGDQAFTWKCEDESINKNGIFNVLVKTSILLD